MNIESKHYLGLIGRDIQHSKSKAMYEKILAISINYTLFDYKEASEIPTLDELFEKVQGLSITTPYKGHFIDKVVVEDKIRELNAINCIVKNNENYYGYNTDYLALREIIEKNYSSGFFFVVLGNGSMANVTKTILSELKYDYTQFTRTQYGDLTHVDLLSLRQLTRPLVIFNACSRSFHFKGKISKDSVFYDFNYSMKEHEYLRKICHYVDGLELLENQARYALQLWKIVD